MKTLTTKMLSVILALIALLALGCTDSPTTPEEETTPWLDDSWIVLNPQPVGAPRTVRLVYFLPKDRTYRPEVVEWLRATVLTVQDFYAEQMTVNGYDHLGFQVETNVNGEFKVHRVLSGHADEHYRNCTFDTIEKEISQAFDIDENIYLVVIDNESEWIINCRGLEVGGTGRRSGKIGGIGLVPEGAEWQLVAHELGHAFGLKHNFKSDTVLMSYGESPRRLTPCYASILSVHPYFNSGVPTENRDPAVAFLPALHESPGKVTIPLAAHSPVGLHHAIFYVMTVEPHAAAGQYELNDCRKWETHLETSAFRYDFNAAIPSNPNIAFSDAIKNPVLVTIIDKQGNISYSEVNIPLQ